ncbi:MAG: DMT family transporter [Hyphomicrobiales bacterium]
MIRKPNTLDYTLLLMLVVIWASAFLAIKVVVPEIGPLWLATIRVLIGFTVLLPWALWRGFIWPSKCRQWRLLTAIAILNVAAPFFLISWAELTIDAGIASLLMGVGPFIALVASHFFTNDDKFTPAKLIAVLLGFTGILVVVGADAILGLGENLPSQLAALCGSACYVASGILIRRLEGFPPVRLSCLVLGIAGVILVAFATVIDGVPNLSISGTAWVLLIYLGLVPTGIGYILRYRLIQAIGVSAFALGLNLIPVFGIAMGAFFLGEAISWTVVVALILVMSGLLVSRMGNQTSTKKD